MKYFLIIILLLQFIACISSKNSKYEPWGIWDNEIVNKNSPIKQILSGEYYYSLNTLSWIGISQNSQGIIAGNYDFPIIAEDGIFVRIEKYEQIDEGFLFYLIGDGIKLKEGKPQFKDNVRLILKMTFISEHECRFQYYSKEDLDGFRYGFFAREDVIYRRYKVQE